MLVPHAGLCQPSQKLTCVGSFLFCCPSSIGRLFQIQLVCVCLFIMGITSIQESTEKHSKQILCTHCPELQVSAFASCLPQIFFFKEIKCYRDHCGSHSPLFPPSSEITTLQAMVQGRSLESLQMEENRAFGILVAWWMVNIISHLFAFIFPWLLGRLNIFHVSWLLGLRLWIGSLNLLPFICLVVCLLLIGCSSSLYSWIILLPVIYVANTFLSPKTYLCLYLYYHMLYRNFKFSCNPVNIDDFCFLCLKKSFPIP